MVSEEVCLSPLGDPRRALIVDDDAGARRSLGLLLKHAGLQTAEADCVAAARQQLEECSFDIVLLDLNLPGEPGLILLSELTPRAPEIVVIVVSADANAAQAVAALKQGAYDYVCKPYQVGALLEAVEQALRRRDEELRRRSFDEELAWLVEERTKNLHDALDRLHDAESPSMRGSWRWPYRRRSRHDMASTSTSSACWSRPRRSMTSARSPCPTTS
jgi:DNA-binding NtrC family response regulator